MAIGVSVSVGQAQVGASYLSPRDREVEAASRDQQCVQDLSSSLPSVAAVQHPADAKGGPLEQLLDTPSPLDRLTNR